MASQPMSEKIEIDLEFEWLLCLSSTFQTSRRPYMAGAARANRPQRFPRTRDREFFEREWKRALRFARNEL
jgi:hypothetical protein